MHGLPNRNLATLKEFKSSLASRLINRPYYSQRTIKRSERSGAGIELIVAALIHDVGNALASENQPQVSATIIRPFSLDEAT